jgi:hypothetical protein
MFESGPYMSYTALLSNYFDKEQYTITQAELLFLNTSLRDKSGCPVAWERPRERLSSSFFVLRSTRTLFALLLKTF